MVSAEGLQGENEVSWQTCVCVIVKGSLCFQQVVFHRSHVALSITAASRVLRGIMPKNNS